jgi:hypothetical protein
MDKYDIQDKAVEKLRAFATSKEVHITLVVHPRKVNSGRNFKWLIGGGVLKLLIC